jgi:ADP-heptose:LPS heptosyltransferase
MERRVLFVNFTGLGNAIAALGLFRALEQGAPRWKYFHTECCGLDDPALIARAGIRNFLGLCPAHWRRFSAEDWCGLVSFLEANRIDTIINLRNEGPQRDRGYANFKQTFADSFTFFDLNTRYERDMMGRSNLFALHEALLRDAGIPDRRSPSLWLARKRNIPAGSGTEPGEIGFFTAASQEVKTWSVQAWIELGTSIIERGPHKLAVFAGRTTDDLQRATHIAEQLKTRTSARRVRVVANLSVVGLADALSDLTCLVSNDTAAVHMGAALDIPTVGLYFATIGEIWGGRSPVFSVVQSDFGARCRYQKANAGNCTYFHGGCPAPCRDEITSEQVYAVIVNLLKLRPAPSARIYDGIADLLNPSRT